MNVLRPIYLADIYTNNKEQSDGNPERALGVYARPKKILARTNRYFAGVAWAAVYFRGTGWSGFAIYLCAVKSMPY